MGVVIGLGEGQLTIPFRLVGDADEMVCTIGFQDNTSLTPNQVADALMNPLLATPTFNATSVSNQYTIGPGRVVVNRSLGTFQGVGATTRIGTSATTPPLPQNNCVLIHKRTSRGGRQGRGRMYFPAFMVSETNVTAVGGVLASVCVQLDTDLASWISAAAAASLFLVLQHSAPPVGPPLPRDAITSLTCDPIVATQRRRLRR